MSDHPSHKSFHHRLHHCLALDNGGRRARTQALSNGGVDTDQVTPFPTDLCVEIAKAIEHDCE